MTLDEFLLRMTELENLPAGWYGKEPHWSKPGGLPTHPEVSYWVRKIVPQLIDLLDKTPHWAVHPFIDGEITVDIWKSRGLEKKLCTLHFDIHGDDRGFFAYFGLGDDDKHIKVKYEDINEETIRKIRENLSNWLAEDE